MATKSYRFGSYTVDLARREVHRGATRLDLPAKVFDCVSYLIEHRDRAVGRDELISAVWGRADISDNLLAQIVLRARRAFDDDADAQRFIRTITGFGYRWVYDFGESLSEESMPASTSAHVATADDSGPVPTNTVLAQAQPSIISSLPSSDASPHARKNVPALSLPRPQLWKVVFAIFAVLFIVKGAMYFAAERPSTAPTSRPLALVLPAVLRDAPDAAWARLGIMDLIAQRLREAGQPTVPSETVVSIVKLAGETPTPQELADLTASSGANMFIEPEVTRQSTDWHVSLRRLGDGKAGASYEGVSADLVQAANVAIGKLTTALDLAPLPYLEGSGPGATLAQQVASELLQDRLGDARALIENAPLDVRNDPRVRLQRAAVDFYQSRLPEARATLTKLAAESSRERSPEFNARVITALASLENRTGDYAAGERMATKAIDSVKNLDTAMVGNVLGSALMVRAVSRMQQAAYEKAADDFAASRAVLTTAGNVRTLALVDSNYSMMQMQRDRFVEAVPSLNKSAEYFRRLGAPIRELLDRNKIAGCHLALQDFSAAADEDARLADLIARVEDPEVRSAAKGMRAEIAFARGKTSDAEALVQELLADAGLSDVVRGPVLLVDSRLAMERGDHARAIASARAGLALKWHDEQPREYATTWLLLVRANRKAAPEKSAEDAARARAWGAPSIYPSVGLLLDLLEAEQLASRGQDAPARAAFERALRTAGEREVPSDMVEVTTSYATWLIEKHDFERAVAVLGRNQPWADKNFRVAVAEARLYRAIGNEKLWRSALERAQQTAGERAIPNDISEFEPAKIANADGTEHVAAR